MGSSTASCMVCVPALGIKMKKQISARAQEKVEKCLVMWCCDFLFFLFIKMLRH